MIPFTRDRDAITISSATAVAVAVLTNIEIVIFRVYVPFGEATKLYVYYPLTPVSASLDVVFRPVLDAACNPLVLLR